MYNVEANFRHEHFAQKCCHLRCCGYVVVVVDCRVEINGGRIVDVLRTMVGMVSILEC